MFKKYTCLIIDDEQAAHFVLQNYIARVANLEIAGQCYSAVEAIQFLQKQSVDFIFLDMEMPEISGLEMLKSFPNLPKTILTTAYADYALVGYDYGVVDYLLKPFEFARFLKAIHRIMNPVSKAANAFEQKILTIKVDNSNKRVPIQTISYVQSIGNYVRVFTTNEQAFLTLMTLTKIENTLPKESFLRVHKSYIVNLQMLEQLRDQAIQLKSGEVIPVGITYKRKLREFWSHQHGKDT